MTPTHPCCTTWDNNTPIVETPNMRTVYDAYPVTPGHALIYPLRHAESFTDLSLNELWEIMMAVHILTTTSDANDFTIAVNDGPLAGRTIPHLHIHVIPRREGDVPDPRGGVRQLFVTPTEDPWIREHQ